METTILARGEKVAGTSNHKKIIRIVAIVAAALFVIGLISNISNAAKAVKNHEHNKWCYSYEYRSDFSKDNKNNDLKDYKMDCDYTNAFSMGFKRYFNGGFLLPLIVLGVGLAVGMSQKKKALGYVITVSEQAVNVAYANGKTTELPIGSIFSLNKEGDKGLNIVTSENAYTLKDMDGRDEVYDAITKVMPTITVKGPANNEQVLAKGYPPAIKPLLLVLLILFSLAAVITAIAAEVFAVILIGIVPVGIVLVLYLLAKTPYLVVTDKRVFYVSDFRRKLSIPLNKVTVCVTHWWFKQLHIAGPAGRIFLFGVKNTAELYDTICALLNEKQ